jgi:hypothetical protein
MGGTTRETEFIDSPGGCKTGERRCEEMSQAWLRVKLQRSLGSKVILRLSDFQTLRIKVQSPENTKSWQFIPDQQGQLPHSVCTPMRQIFTHHGT